MGNGYYGRNIISGISGKKTGISVWKIGYFGDEFRVLRDCKYFGYFGWENGYFGIIISGILGMLNNRVFRGDNTGGYFCLGKYRVFWSTNIGYLSDTNRVL